MYHPAAPGVNSAVVFGHEVLFQLLLPRLHLFLVLRQQLLGRFLILGLGNDMDTGWYWSGSTSTQSSPKCTLMPSMKVASFSRLSSLILRMMPPFISQAQGSLVCRKARAGTSVKDPGTGAFRRCRQLDQSWRWQTSRQRRPGNGGRRSARPWSRPG